LQQTPIIDDPGLTQDLGRRLKVGSFVPEDLFQPVAVALTRAGAV
jgi:type III secretory pathway component EscU